MSRPLRLMPPGYHCPIARDRAYLIEQVEKEILTRVGDKRTNVRDTYGAAYLNPDEVLRRSICNSYGKQQVGERCK